MIRYSRGDVQSMKGCIDDINNIAAERRSRNAPMEREEREGRDRARQNARGSTRAASLGERKEFAYDRQVRREQDALSRWRLDLKTAVREANNVRRSRPDT